MNNIFKNEAAEFVYKRTYSRWIEEEKRRENWHETVQRFMDFIKTERGELIPNKVIKKMHEKILNFEVMPSMRAMWSAGNAAKKDNTTMYNCSFLGIDSIDSFAEMFYILMCGTGVGFSVEQKYINKFPIIPQLNNDKKELFKVPDNREGWADSLKFLINKLYEGEIPDFDYTLIRPKGSRLITMGGRSSGPEPLMILHSFIKDIFGQAQGRQLTSLECHDICNQIADSVVVGGVRRSSQISLSNLDDILMRNAKIYPFPPRRSMANNSAIYYEKPSAVDFLKEWSSLASSGSGERGIFNINSAIENSPKRRNSEKIAGTNPCGEILLRNKQFCNLSEIVIREDDDIDSLLEKIETSVWIGAIQSTFTYFPYLRKEWKKNCDEERLLGCSLTGQMDNPKILTNDVCKLLKQKAQKVAKHACEKLNINNSTAITCIKPSGTVSQLVDCSSGIHTRFAKYYIRRYRISATDPLINMLKSQGIKLFPENDQENLSDDKVTTWVISFPIKAPENCITRSDMNAIEQLEWYKKIQTNYCEHNASMTVYVKDSEWFNVGNWIYQNWNIINGVSFLPFDGGKYKQAPYEEITEKQYNEMIEKMPKIDYNELSKFELEDNTEGAKMYNCSGDKCEIT